MNKEARDKLAKESANRFKTGMELIGHWDQVAAEALMLTVIEKALIMENKERNAEKRDE